MSENNAPNAAVKPWQIGPGGERRRFNKRNKQSVASMRTGRRRAPLRARKAPRVPAVATACITTFAREKTFLEFDRNYPCDIFSAMSEPAVGTLTLENPSQDTATFVRFDAARSNDALAVTPCEIAVAAGATADLRVEFRPTAHGAFRGKIYFQATDRVRIEVMVTALVAETPPPAPIRKHVANHAFDIAAVSGPSRGSITDSSTTTAAHTATVDTKVAAHANALVDPHVARVFHSRPLGIVGSVKRHPTKPKQFAFVRTRRMLREVDDIPAAPFTSSSTHAISSSAAAPKKPKKNEFLRSSQRQGRSEMESEAKAKATKEAALKNAPKVRSTTTNKNKSVRLNTRYSVAAHARKPRHKLKLKLNPQRRSSDAAPPAGATHARRSNAMVRSRHAQIRRVLYDEKSADKQAWGFTVYLNDTFYPPEDALSALSSSSPSDAVISSASASCPEGGAPATTRDHFRTLLHKQRQASVRRRAFRIYHSRDMDNVCYNIDREVASGKIAIRKDREVSVDLGLRKRILDIMLCYHPVWLRLGLETVFGEIIPMRASNAHDGGASVLKRFMKHRLLNDPDTTEKFKTTRAGIFGEGYALQLGKLTLRRFLMVVLFLDRAKLSAAPETIPGGPCLFTKSSMFKTSRDVVVTFAKEFLSGEGDVTRHLKLMGYELGYNQTPLDEVDYTVTSLATDLRDGVKLVRLVEILDSVRYSKNGKHSRPLSQRLRMPAGSRLQKKHNVTLALNALKKAGLQLTGLNERGMRGNICSDDVINGHCEKTLALLWRMIYRSKIESDNSASSSSAIVSPDLLEEEIARVRHAHSSEASRFEAAQYKKDKDERLVDGIDDAVGEGSGDRTLVGTSKAVQRLLRWCRAVCASSDLRVPIFNFTTSFADGRALCAILNFYHPTVLPLCEMHKTTADLACKSPPGTPTTSSIDAWSAALSVDAADISPSDYASGLKGERANFMLFNKAVKSIGSVPAGMVGGEGYQLDSNNLPEEKTTVLLVFHLCARVLESSKEIHACLKIQAKWRHVLKKRRRVKSRTAACILQRAFLQTRGRSRFRAFRRNIIRTQAMLRACIQRWSFQRKRVAALAMQSQFRRHKATATVADERQSRITLLACNKRVNTMRIAYCTRQRGLAASKICALVRGHLVRQHIEASAYASVVVASAVRMYISRCRFVKKCEAAKVMQRLFRGYKCRLGIQSRHKSSTTIATLFRGFRERALYFKTCALVVRMQVHVRMKLARRELSVREKKHEARCAAAATVIARIVCGYQCRIRISRMHSATTKIQCIFRCHINVSRYTAFRNALIRFQRAFRRNANQKHSEEAVTSIQAMWRRFSATCMLASTKQAIICVQSLYRRNRDKQKLAVVIWACIMIQSSVRAHKARAAFAMSRAAAIKLQSFARTHSARTMYAEKKTAVTTLQSAWRCFCVHSDFVAMTKASIIIQTETRRMQTNRTYCASIRAIISVQRMIRQSHARRELQRRRCQRFASMTMAAVKIQSCYRRRMAEHVLCCAIRACIMIQSSVRAHKARAAFAMSRAAAIKLQSFARTHSARTMYAEKKTAVTTLQRAWNYYNKRKRFMIRIAAAIKIQSVIFRGFHQRSLFKSIVRKRQNSAIRLQTSIRKHVQRIAFLHAKRAAIQVQIASRGFLARLSFRSMRSALVIQRTARKWIAIIMLSNVRRTVASLQAKVRGMQTKSRYKALQEISNKIGSLQRGRVARRQFHAFRCAVLSLQTAFRRRLARLVLVQRRADYYYALAHASRIMQSACKIQRTFKKYSWRQRRVWAAKIIQRKAKLYLMMLRASLIKFKLEKLQSFWRGCIARSRVHSNKKLTEMRARVARANVNAREDMTLGHRTKAALCVLLSSKNLSEVFSAIKTLEMSTRWSSTCCSCFVGEASEALPIMYGLIRSCNRSQPHRKLLVHALRVLSNVWPYEIALTTGGNTSSQRRLVPALTPRMEILVDLMQMYRDQSATFRMAARLARWLCSSPERAMQVNADHDIMKRLNSIHAVLSRKAKMAALSKRKHGGSSRSQNRHQEPAAQCVVAIASLIHTISNGDM